jgi:hypothetical protein
MGCRDPHERFHPPAALASPDRSGDILRARRERVGIVAGRGEQLRARRAVAWLSVSDSDSEAAVGTAAALVLATLRQAASTSRVDRGQDRFARDPRCICANEGHDLFTAGAPEHDEIGSRRFRCCLLGSSREAVLPSSLVSVDQRSTDASAGRS